MAAKGASLIDRRGGRTNLWVMFSRLTRILLALVTAFVFTGQMEAAAQHCARLAKAAAIVAAAEPDRAPCHESQAAAENVHAAMSHDHALMDHGAPGHASDHSGKANSPHCECIAALTGWIDLDGATITSHVEAYAWFAPAEATFASSDTDPDLRPPRA